MDAEAALAYFDELEAAGEGFPTWKLMLRRAVKTAISRRNFRKKKGRLATREATVGPFAVMKMMTTVTLWMLTLHPQMSMILTLEQAKELGDEEDVEDVVEAWEEDVAQLAEVGQQVEELVKGELDNKKVQGDVV